MEIRVKNSSFLCEKCGAILYEGMDLKPPYEIVKRYNGKCPKCGRKLFSDPINFEVTKIEQSVSV
jgi:predicted  nucleic acid-binding Zn-ribbon protein